MAKNTEQTKTANLYQRISAVMADVEYLKKDDTVSGFGAGYKAISEEKVTESVRAALIKHGLVILPVAQTHKLEDLQRPTKDGKISTVSLTTVDVTYRIINIDNPAEYTEVVSSGTGVDTQDKGVGKAITYAYKYMLLRVFAIPTGEDPDKIHNSKHEAQQAETARLKNEVAAIQKEASKDQLIKIEVALAHGLIKDPGTSDPEWLNRIRSGYKTFNEMQAQKAIAKLEELINERESYYAEA